MPATVLTKPKRATRSTSTGLNRVATKKIVKTNSEEKRKKELEKLGAELQEITVKLIKEKKLKPFNRKDIYGNL